MSKAQTVTLLPDKESWNVKTFDTNTMSVDDFTESQYDFALQELKMVFHHCYNQASNQEDPTENLYQRALHYLDTRQRLMGLCYLLLKDLIDEGHPYDQLEYGPHRHLS